MKAIDFKSIVIGVLIGVCVMLAIGQIRNPVGRWQVVNTDKVQGIVVDSSTGEVSSLRDLLLKQPAVSSVQETNPSTAAIELAKNAFTLDSSYRSENKEVIHT